ncbi:hypothetical protein M422DRAFT_88109, partial [Sphaerobolus stellatus SS14]
PSDIHVNQTLIRHGCIGTAPSSPRSAFTIRTQSLYRQSHSSCPRFSVEAEVRVLCNMNRIPYSKAFAEQFRIAYDAYIEVLYHVDALVDKALAQDKPNWRALNTCPACDYRLEGEPELEYSKLVAIDGNNSLCRVDVNLTRNVTSYIDTRTARTDYWIKPEEVDLFKDQVKSKQSTVALSANHEQGIDEEVLVENDEPGDAASGAASVSVCVERWRNAGPEERKKMWQMFTETGIFLAACHHGFILYLCDMIRSGELAKYPLAITNKLIDVYGDGLCIGYDIGCAFSST